MRGWVVGPRRTMYTRDEVTRKVDVFPKGHDWSLGDWGECLEARAESRLLAVIIRH